MAKIFDKELQRKVNKDAVATQAQIEKMNRDELMAVTIPSLEVYQALMIGRYLDDNSSKIGRIFKFLTGHRKWLLSEIDKQYERDVEPLYIEQRGLILDAFRDKRSTLQAQTRGSKALENQFKNGQAVPNKSDGSTVSGTQTVKQDNSNVDDGHHVNLSVPSYVPFYEVFGKVTRSGSITLPLGKAHDNSLISIDLKKVVHFNINGETEIGKSSVFKCAAASIMLRDDNVIFYSIDMKKQTFNRFGVNDRIASTFDEAIQVLDLVIKEAEERSMLMDKGYDSFEGYVSDTGDNRPRIILFIDELITLAETMSLEDSKKAKDFVSKFVVLATTYRIYGITLAVTVQNINAKNFPGGTTVRDQFKTKLGFATDQDNAIKYIFGSKADEVKKAGFDFRGFNKGEAVLVAKNLGNEPMRIQTPEITPEEMQEVANRVDVNKFFVDFKKEERSTNSKDGREPANVYVGTILGAPVASSTSYSDSEPVEVGLSEGDKIEVMKVIHQMMGHSKFNAIQRNVKAGLSRHFPQIELSKDELSTLYHDVAELRVKMLFESHPDWEPTPMAKAAYGVKNPGKLVNRVEEIMGDLRLSVNNQ